MIKVSVLIPTFNYARFLDEAIESVLCQTYQNYEIIIIDNCSTDNTKEIMSKYLSNHKIKYINNDENIGMFRNYNESLLYANGEYIKFLNADDKLHSEALQEMVHILDKYKSVSLVTSKRKYFGNKNDILNPPFEGLIDGKKAIEECLYRFNWIGEPTTVMFRRKNLNLGLFDMSYLMFADLDMWIKQLYIGDLYIIDEVLSYFRIHEKQGTNLLNDNFEKSLYNNLQMFIYKRNLIENNQFCTFTNRVKKDIKRRMSEESFHLIRYYFKKTKYKNEIRDHVHYMLMDFIKIMPMKIYKKIRSKYGS